VVHAVLEEMPKWGVLVDVLTEVQEERARLAGSDAEADRQAAAAPVVVMAREAHTCAQLREVGGRAMFMVTCRVKGSAQTEAEP
jgi:GTP cyclohydrolase I